MFENQSQMKAILEKIAKELEIANKLKIYEIVVSQPGINYKILLKFFDKSDELAKEIEAKMKEQ
jgi:hypothetical protein